HGGGGRGGGVDGSGRVCGGGGRAVVLGDRHGLPLRVVLPRILGPAPTGGFRAVVLGGAAPPAETVPLETLAGDAAVGGGRAAKGPGVRPAGRSVGGRVAGPALGPVTRPVAGRVVRLGTGLVGGRSGTGRVRCLLGAGLRTGLGLLRVGVRRVGLLEPCECRVRPQEQLGALRREDLGGGVLVRPGL